MPSLAERTTTAADALEAVEAGRDQGRASLEWPADRPIADCWPRDTR